MPEQLQLHLSFGATVIQHPGPNGTIILKPGRIVATTSVSVSQAVRQTGYSRSTIIRMLHSGELAGSRRKGVRRSKWRIYAASLDTLRADPVSQTSDISPGSAP